MIKLLKVCGAALITTTLITAAPGLSLAQEEVSLTTIMPANRPTVVMQWDYNQREIDPATLQGTTITAPYVDPNCQIKIWMEPGESAMISVTGTTKGRYQSMIGHNTTNIWPEVRNKNYQGLRHATVYDFIHSWRSFHMNAIYRKALNIAAGYVTFYTLIWEGVGWEFDGIWGPEGTSPYSEDGCWAVFSHRIATAQIVNPVYSDYQP